MSLSSLIAVTLVTPILATVAWAGPISGAGGDGPDSGLSVAVGPMGSAPWIMPCGESWETPAIAALDFKNGFVITIADKSGSYLPLFGTEFLKRSSALHVKQCGSKTTYSSSDDKIIYSEPGNAEFGPIPYLQLFISPNNFAGMSSTSSGSVVSLNGDTAKFLLSTLKTKVGKEVPKGQDCVIETATVYCSVDSETCSLKVKPLLASADFTARLKCAYSAPPPSR